MASHNQNLRQPGVLHKDIHIHNPHLGSKIKKESKKQKKTWMDHIHGAYAKASGCTLRNVENTIAGQTIHPRKRGF